MANNSEILMEVNKKVTTLEDLLNEERIRQLEELLVRFNDLVTSYYSEGEDEDGEDLYPKDFIMTTFLFEKPVTSIEIGSMNLEEVVEFRGELEKFFFVEYTPSEIFISRFRTLCDVAIGIKNRNDITIKLSHNFPDLEGFFYGKPLKEIARYCLKKKKYHLIK